MSNIETPMVNDSITNQQANKKNSLCHSCKYVLNALSTIPVLKPYLNQLETSSELSSLSTPLTKLWEFCKQGITLCLLYNTLDQVSPIDLDSLVNSKPKIYVYKFLYACKKQLELDQDVLFIIADLFQDDTNGFVKVVDLLKILLNTLESKGIIQIPLLPQKDTSLPKDTRDKIVMELLETERKYVQDLETLQKYMNHAQENKVLPPDTLHQLFGNLNSLVDFQRRFLMHVETQADNEPSEQRFGLLFVQFEEAFQVYEPFCANFQTAQDLIVSQVQALEQLSHLLSANFELPSILIKPVQRICKYPLLMKELLKVTPQEWTYHDEIEQGLNAILRVASKVNETKRRQENHSIVQELKKKVYDWSISDIDDYGQLLLQDRFMIYRGQPGRELIVYLFEDCIFVCREERFPSSSSLITGSSNENNNSNKKNKKKENNTSDGSSSNIDYRLYVRGRILMSRIAQVIDVSKDNQWHLQIYWSNKTNHAKEYHQQQQGYGLESFTLKCRNQEQLQLWESTLSTLLKQIKQKAREAKTALLLQSQSTMNLNTTTHSPPLLSNHSSPSEYGSYTVPTTPTSYGLSLSEYLDHTQPHDILEKNKQNDEQDEEGDDDDDDNPLYTFTSSHHSHLNHNDSIYNNNNGEPTNNNRLSFYNSTPGMSLPPLPRDGSSHSYIMNHPHDHDHYQSVPATELVTQHMLNEYDAETSYEDTFDTYFSFTSPPPSSTQLSFLSHQQPNNNNNNNINKPLPHPSNNHYHQYNINNPARLRSQSSPNIHQTIKNYQNEKVTTPSLPPISTNSIYHHYHTLYSNNNNQPSTSKQDKRKSNGDQDLRRPLYSYDHHHSSFSTNYNNNNHINNHNNNYNNNNYNNNNNNNSNNEDNEEDYSPVTLYQHEQKVKIHRQQLNDLVRQSDQPCTPHPCHHVHLQQQIQMQHLQINENQHQHITPISPSAIKVKVHHSGSIYVLVVPTTIKYEELVRRIEKKMRWDSNHMESSTNENHHDIITNGLKYQDEDGDYITVSSNDDLQMGFESQTSNNTVNFYIV